MPSLKLKMGPDRLVAAASAGTAVALALFGLAHEPVVALIASFSAGISWIAVVATLNVSAQVSLPDWVRGRGLAMYITVFSGAMTLGGAIWGQVAAMTGLPMTHFAAAGGMLLAIPPCIGCGKNGCGTAPTGGAYSRILATPADSWRRS
jgi:predicted MFS family arabinose efflux permease